MQRQFADTDKTVIFLHIPKTAGTTLDQIIFRHYRFKDVYQTGLISQQGVAAYKSMNRETRARYRLLKGHMSFGIHQYVPNPFAYFTFLREPVDRTISHFYFIYRSESHPLYELIHEDGLNMSQYLEERLDPMLFNAHTRLLSGVWDGIPAGELSAVHLKQAKENLARRVEVVGLTERFDESLLLLGRAFGWRHLYYKRLNVTKKRPQRDTLSPASLAAVKAANRLDLELYQYGVDLFRRQVAALGPEFAAEVRRFRFNNRFVQPLVALYWEMRKISVRVYLKEQLARFRPPEEN